VSDKQIFASLEISDHEVRMVVGEFFNNHFNVIKVEKVSCFGVSYDAVTDRDEVINAIKTALAGVKKTLGADVKKVILAMPSYRFKRIPVKSTVDVEGIDRVVTIQDVRNAIHKAERSTLDKQYALIQAVCTKYEINGVATKRIPLGEHANKLNVSIDLLCADRKFSFDLVECVEEAGVSVLDIFPDVYADSKEAALFELSKDKQVVLLKVERNETTLCMLKEGRLVSAALFPAGVGEMCSNVVDKYGISSDMAVELFKYSTSLDMDSATSNPVHIWANGDKTETITEREFVEAVDENVENWVQTIAKTCLPILQAGETTVIITDEGGETIGLSHRLEKVMNVETRSYIPETLGGRNSSLTTCLGLCYAYQDKLPIAGYIEDSLDMDAFSKAVAYRENADKKQVLKEDTLTNKLKGLFLEGKK